MKGNITKNPPPLEIQERKIEPHFSTREKILATMSSSSWSDRKDRIVTFFLSCTIWLRRSNRRSFFFNSIEETELPLHHKRFDRRDKCVEFLTFLLFFDLPFLIISSAFFPTSSQASSVHRHPAGQTSWSWSTMADLCPTCHKNYGEAKIDKNCQRTVKYGTLARAKRNHLTN